MLKKLLLSATVAVMSIDASATAFIQYNLSGGGVSGFFYQNADDKSIAGYSIYFDAPDAHAHFGASGSYDYLGYQSSNFWGVAGPTNFSVHDRLTEVYESDLIFNFTQGATPGSYAFNARYTQVVDMGYPSWGTPLHPLSVSFVGTVAGVPLHTEIDAYNDGIEHVIPFQNVPEPASIALFAVGALGAASVVRRRKSHG